MLSIEFISDICILVIPTFIINANSFHFRWLHTTQLFFESGWHTIVWLMNYTCYVYHETFLHDFLKTCFLISGSIISQPDGCVDIVITNARLEKVNTYYTDDFIWCTQ